MDEIAAVLAPQGIELIRYPVNPATFPGPSVPSVGQAFDRQDGKILAFCRTGTRSANLWVLSRPASERAAALQKARQSGFEVSLAERVLGG
jgi:sulfide:quinone oxidoreductase